MNFFDSVGRGLVVGRAFGVLALGAALAVAAPGCGGADEGPPGDTGSGDDEGQLREGAEGEAARPGGGSTPPSTIDTRLRKTLEDLAGFGEKRAGTTKGRQAGDYVRSRFGKAGLRDVRFETFTLNGFELASSSLALTKTVDGQAQALPIAGHQVFAYSGAGSLADVEVADVGQGREENYVVPVTGKVVLVQAVQDFHRINQLRLALEHGAVGMISVSFSPSNLVQVGQVSLSELGLGAAPVFSIGGADGAAVRAAIAAGQPVRVSASVNASIAEREGRNVIGRLKRPYSRPGDPYILVGAHYDTWGTGSTDNSTGVASMLELAETLSRWPSRRYDVVFVAYDAEEIGLLGGYDYLRKHVIRGGDSIVAFLHLEMTGRAKPEFQGDLLARYLVHTQGGPLGRVAQEADMASIYPLVLGLENVAPTLGGNIPTDVQGMYWHGIDGTIVFGASPFYHTAADTPDTIDLPFLASNTLALKKYLDELDQEPSASFNPRDENLLYPEVHLDTSNPALTRVDVTVRDLNGQVVPTPWARLQLYVDDFITPQQAGVSEANSGVQERIGDQNGKVTFDVASSLLQAGDCSRWLQVRVGNESERFPRGESFNQLP